MKIHHLRDDVPTLPCSTMLDDGVRARGRRNASSFEAPRREVLQAAIRVALAGGLGAMAVAPAFGQAAPTNAPAKAAAPGAAASASELQTVVITAENKVATEQKTPIAMSVYDGGMLAALGVNDLRALSTLAPDVSFAESGSSLPVITMRGISSRDTTEVGDPAVAVAIDGTYSNRPYGLSASLYDLDRIEVLRGPQGTLFGRNATGGALSIVTMAPAKYFGGYASVDIGNYGTRNLEAALNIPLSDTVQMRASVSSRYHEGYDHNGLTNNADDEDSRSGRLTFAFQPTSRLKAQVTAQTTQMRGVGVQSVQSPFVFDANGDVAHDGISFPGDGRTFTLQPQLAYLHMDENLVRGQATYSFDPFDLTYVGGFSKIQYHHGDDQTTPGSSPYGFVQNEFPKTQSHELRLSSKSGGVLDWQAGVFYFKEDSHLDSYDAALGSNGRIDRLFGFLYRTVAQSTAEFAQASYRPIEKLTLTAGIRHTQDRKTREGDLVINSGSVEPITYFNVPSDAKGAWSKNTFHLAANYDLTAQNMVYAKYDTGFKAGGFTDIAPYDPEQVKGFEFGSKNRFLDNKLQVNLAAFDYRYTGQQVSEYVTGPNGEVATEIVNAGRSKIYGFEADATAIASDFGRFSASLAYLHARFADFVVGLNGANVQLAGNRPPQSPTMKLGVGWEKSLDAFKGSITPRVDLHYESAQNYTFWNYDSDRQSGFVKADVSATYAPENGKWSVQGYVRNVGNKTTVVSAEDSAFSGTYRWTMAAPRTLGVKLTAYW